MPGLSARERAILVLRAFKEKKPQDQRLGHGMDQFEVREYNRLIRLMNACNLEVLTMVIMLRERVAKIGLKLGWLATLEMWREHADKMEVYLRGFTKEPITESAYKALLAAEPDRWAPAGELADVLTSRKADWDQEQIEDAERRVVHADEWEKETERNKQQLVRLVKSKALEGRRRGGELEIRIATFYAWLGEEVAIRPAWGIDYDPVPDADVASVNQLKASRERIRLTLAGRDAGDEAEQGPPIYKAMAGGLKPALKAQIQSTWSELIALDAALVEVAREFDGEDVLRPETRADLDSSRRDLEEAHVQLQMIVGEFELPELDQDEVRQNLEFIQYFAERQA
jgi:hypothetical protein